MMSDSRRTFSVSDQVIVILSSYCMLQRIFSCVFMVHSAANHCLYMPHLIACLMLLDFGSSLLSCLLSWFICVYNLHSCNLFPRIFCMLVVNLIFLII